MKKLFFLSIFFIFLSQEGKANIFDNLRDKGPKKIGPYGVTKSMSSSISAIIATALKLKGVNYSISSACATSAHCIGHAADLIKSGQQDVVIAGGSDDEHWSSSCLFDAMGALSSNFNTSPTSASRPYDVNRDGFVISGGAGMIILEEEEHAKKIWQNYHDILQIQMVTTWLHRLVKVQSDVWMELLSNLKSKLTI